MAKKKKRTKSNKISLLTVVILLVMFCSYSSLEVFGGLFWKPIKYKTYIPNLELPYIKDSSHYVVNQKGRFSYMYSPQHKQSLWVAYMLTKSDLKGKRVKRSDDFRPDPIVLAKGWKSSNKQDYYKSSFDRGHLLPSADRAKNRTENEETFILSNISPQKAVLNRNIWRELETQVREWANKYDTLYIVTGGVLYDEKLGYIGKNKVSIPNSFFKVVMSVKNGEYNSIGFVIPNKTTLKSDFMNYSMSVDKVEKISKLDFYNNLPNRIERKVEKKVNKIYWK